jgi:membrane protein involved in colicin uptake
METSKRNLTRDEKLSLQQDQLLAQKGKQIEAANGNEDALETITGNRDKSGKYRVLVLEQNYVHVKTIIKHLDQSQKNFVNEEKIHKIHAREFDRRVREGAFKTYDEVEVLHDPRANAPESYNLKGDFAEVTTGTPSDANVQLKTSNKIPPAGKPGEGSKVLTGKEKAAADKKAAEQKAIDDKKAADEAEALRLQQETAGAADDLPNLGDVDPNAPKV